MGGDFYTDLGHWDVWILTSDCPIPGVDCRGVVCGTEESVRPFPASGNAVHGSVFRVLMNRFQDSGFLETQFGSQRLWPWH